MSLTLLATILWLLVGAMGCGAILIVGMLSAFWPINDKATTGTHKVVSITVTIVILCLWLQLFKVD